MITHPKHRQTDKDTTRQAKTYRDHLTHTDRDGNRKTERQTERCRRRDGYTPICREAE